MKRSDLEQLLDQQGQILALFAAMSRRMDDLEALIRQHARPSAKDKQ
jgi:hypothetical protein